MVKQVVRLTVNITINEGQLEAFKGIAQAMNEGAKAEPGTLGYEWFADSDGRSFSLLETYVDAAAVEAHFAGHVVQQLVPKLAAICAINGFFIYGDPGPKVAQMAGGMGAVILPYWLGIGR